MHASIHTYTHKIEPLVPGKKSDLLQGLKGVTFFTSCLQSVRRRTEKEALQECAVFMQLRPAVTTEQGFT